MSHRYTAPLQPDEHGLPPEYYSDGSVGSDGYRLVALVHKYWFVKGKPLRLDEWQQHLLIRILERCPPGHARAGQLRYKQTVVSIPRQNGKSLLAAVLSLYGLVQHTTEPKVLGIARNVKQANIVYNYTATAIRASAGLSKILRTTGTRGIRRIDAEGIYDVLAGDSDAIHGFESSLAICDELHVLRPEIWNQVVESQFANPKGLIIGITTAGDIHSVLLKTLYETGTKAIAGGMDWFGFFVYEASSDEVTLDNIIEANPAIAAGRVDAQSEYEKCLTQPHGHVKQFRLNLFTEGLSDPWLPKEAWAKCAGRGLTDFSDAFYGIEIHDNYEHATIYAAKKIDGVVKTAVVARLIRPSQEQLQDVATRLKKQGRCTFVMDGYRKTKTLANWMDSKGWKVIRIGNGGSRVEAAAMTYAAVMRQEVEHDNTALVNNHHATAVMKNDTLSGKEIDMAIASVYAIYAALITNKKKGVGLS